MSKLTDKIAAKILGHDSTHEVPNKEMLKYAAGIIGQNNAVSLIASWFQYFCISVLYMNPLILGTVLSISRVWDAVNDPIVGSIIDKHTFKNGEKLRPWLKLTPIPMGILLVILFTDFHLPQTYQLVFIAVFYFLFDFLYSFQDIAQWGMTAMMATSSKERERISQLGRFAATVGTWLPGLIPVLIPIAVGLAPDFGVSENTMEKNIFFIFAVVFGFGGMLLSRMGHAARERAPAKKVEGNVLAGLKLIFKNKIVMLLVLSSVLEQCTLVLDQIYFFKYMVSFNILGMEIDGMTSSFIFGLLVGLPGTFTMLLAVKFSRKVGGMKNVIVIAVVATIVCRMLAYAVGFSGLSIVFTGILLAIASIPTSMKGIATTALWCDSLDYIELKHGQRNDGSVFAMQNFVSKIGGAIKTFLVGVTFTILAFSAKAADAGEPMSDAFAQYSWPIFILGPVFGSMLALIPLLFLKHSKKQQMQIEEELKLKRLVRQIFVTDIYSRPGIRLGAGSHSPALVEARQKNSKCK
ncbi:MAG: MFS transporter [Clostridiales bacterium]|jgi:Na+/melibiose symporter-like transporter|nr:MFS transporter [Clostridiales bacterium]